MLKFAYAMSFAACVGIAAANAASASVACRYQLPHERSQVCQLEERLDRLEADRMSEAMGRGHIPSKFSNYGWD